MSEKIILLKNWDQTLIIFRSADNNSGFKKIAYSFTLHRQTETDRNTDRQIYHGRKWVCIRAQKHAKINLSVSKLD